MTASPGVTLISGIMAAGKSTVAQELAERLTRSVHLRGDVFRRMIVSGRAEMGPDLSDEAVRQLRLRQRIAVRAAESYVEDGFAVVYQDILLGDDLERVARSLPPLGLRVVVLAPEPSVVAQREAARDKSGYGSAPVSLFDDELRLRTPRLGLWLDTSGQTPRATVDEILARWDEALV